MGGRLRSVLIAGSAALGGVLALPAAGASATPLAGGYDVSHPQCGEDLPSSAAFVVVGVNGGRATTPNPCLATQLRWARQTTAGHEDTEDGDTGDDRRGATGDDEDTDRPPVQLYLNTANPGEVRDEVTTWPAASGTPYGWCDRGNTTACSWQYGWERARESINEVFAPAAEAAGVDPDPEHYTWWLDVEIANTWQSGSAAALARNRAALEGMAAYVVARGGRPGVYAFPPHWRQIVGTVPPQSTLSRLVSWVAGASSEDEAEENCDRPPLGSGGRVELAQYVSGGLDLAVDC